jgi:NAD(P)H-quinone oxidoreductase subunit 6
MTLLFLVLGVALLALGGMTVITRNLVHQVFLLAGTLLVTACIFVVLHAPFLAAIQLILYAGGVITLMLFGVMLTQRQSSTSVPNPISKQGPAALTAILLFLVLVSTIWSTPALALMQPITMGGSQEIARLFLTDQVLAFEVLSILLLGVMVGAIVLARRRDP